MHFTQGLSNCHFPTRSWLSPLAVALLVTTTVNGFIPKSSRLTKQRGFVTTSRFSSSDHGAESPWAANTVRTCVRNFLTQRSVQSFMFLLEQCRDPHTVNWLHDMYGWKNLLNFHGTGAFNLTVYETWDSVLLDMMSRPADTVVVSARRRGRGHGGWSKDNPYLEDRFVEFEIDIEPASLASRIMSVREQLAAEWEHDFETLISSNDMILSSYFENVMDARDEEEEFDPDSDSEHDDESEHKLETQSFTSPYSNQKPAASFDRNAMQMLLDQTSFETTRSSPLRKGNFDLMVLLSTQESIHRVLRGFKEANKEIPFKWLREFYLEHLEACFDGDQGYGRADDFLEDLLLTPPSVKKVEGKLGLIDTMGIAEEIIRIRGEVAREWKEAMSLVPQEHMELRRGLLALQMGKAIDQNLTESGNFE